MAKKIAVPRRTVPGTSAGHSAAAQGDAQGRFDRFAAFGLALPCTLLALLCMGMAMSYTSDNFGVGFLGLGGSTIQDWDSGSDQIATSEPPQVIGFESHDYIGRVSEGEVDVAIINVGSAHRVNLGDVFVLDSEPANVRLEFVVFEVQSHLSRAYVLLGQNVDGNRGREYSLKRADMERLCGTGASVTEFKVKRPWSEQIVRRYVEERSR